LVRFRWGYVTDYDEATYISVALRDLEGLTNGPRAFVDAVGSPLGAPPPVLPFSAIPLLLVFGRSADVAQVTTPIYSVALVLASYGVARRLMPAWWAVLTALCVGTAPVVSDYARLFHVALPAAALLTAALWALLSSAGLRRTRWVIAAGVLLALMLVTRTMTLAYLPGVMLGVAVPLLLQRADRRLRLRNFLMLWTVTVGIAAVWWVPTLDSALGYLTSAGYGEAATGYGVKHSILSARYWTTELQLVGNYLYLPLSLVILVCFVAAAAFALAREGTAKPWPSRARHWLGSDAFLLVSVVIGGYLALTSTANQGTAFALPWLPSLIVLGVAAATAVPARLARVALAALLVAVCALNVAMKNGLSARLSQPESARIPVIGNVWILDGRDTVYATLERVGYPQRPPPARLLAMHKRWSGLNDRLVRFITAYAAERGRPPFVVVGTGDWLINDTRLALASELAFQRSLRVELITGDPTPESYRRQLTGYRNNILIMSDPPRRPEFNLNPFLLAGTAVELGFRDVKALMAPDDRRITVWWRDQQEAGRRWHEQRGGRRPAQAGRVSRPARVSPTATGCGSKPLSLSRSVPSPTTSAASRPAAAAAARSEPTRSPTTRVAPSPSRSSAVWKSFGSGFPTISALRPAPYSTAARIEPVPGHMPSGCG
jgi:hypothetical protein